MSNLPSLQDEPSYDVTMNTLGALNTEQDYKLVTLEWLMTVLESNMEWLSDFQLADGSVKYVSGQRAEIHGEARQRMVQRCGDNVFVSGTCTFNYHFRWSLGPMTLNIGEQSLARGNVSGALGNRISQAACTMGDLLEHYKEHGLDHILMHAPDGSRIDLKQWDTVLELGSGTGLLGLAAAGAWSTHVVLTDLPCVYQNLNNNFLNNYAAISANDGDAWVNVLDWSNYDGALANVPATDFKIILAADCLYQPEHPQILADTIDNLLKKDKNARAVIINTLRDAHTVQLANEFRDAMTEFFGFEMVINDRFDRFDSPLGGGAAVAVVVTIWRRKHTQ